MIEQLTSVQPPGRSARITLALLIVASLTFCFIMLRPFAGSLFAGAALAVALYPFHRRMHQRITNQTVCAILSTAVACLAFLLPLTLIALTISKELESAYAALGPGTLNGGATQALTAIQPVMDRISSWLGLGEGELQRMLMTRAQEAAGFLVRQFIGLPGAITGGVLKMVITLAALFFLLRDADRILDEVSSLLPWGRRRTEVLLEAAKDAIVASFYGIAIVGLAQGFLCGIGVWIAGLPSPALWGVAAAVVSIIPLFGSALVWIPGSIVLFAQGSYGRGIFLLIWGITIVGTVDNLIRPLVVNTRLSVHPLLLFAAMLGGVSAFGAMGILLGPVTLAVTAALLGMAREMMADRDVVDR
jgi:predicted PurR-regulated permease PerM